MFLLAIEMIFTINLILLLVAYSGADGSTFNVDQNVYPNSIPPIPSQDFTPVSEEVKVDKLIEDKYAPLLFSSTGVRQWQNVKIAEEIFLLGTRDSGITLTVINRKDDRLFQLNERVIDFYENISCAIAFKARSNRDDKYKVQVLIVMQSPSNTIQWYRIENYNLELVTKWNHNALIKDVLHIQNGDGIGTISFLEQFDNNCFLKIYAYSLEQNVPHIWFQELLPLESSASSVSVMVTDETTVLASVQTGSRGITFYRKRNSCNANCKFRRYASVRRMNASKAIPFTMNNGYYFAVSGDPSIIVTVGIDGDLMISSEFRGITQLMVLNLHNLRDDVIIFGKNSASVQVFTYSLFDKKWTRRGTPPCLSSAVADQGYSTNSGSHNGANDCLRNIEWNGATSIIASDDPTIVLAGERVRFVTVMCSLRTTSPYVPFNHEWLTGLHNQFQGSWNRLDNRLSYLLNPSRSREIEDNQSKLCDISQEIDRLILSLQNGKFSLETVDCDRVAVNSTNVENKSSNQDDKVEDTSITYEADERGDAISEEAKGRNGATITFDDSEDDE